MGECKLFCVISLKWAFLQDDGGNWQPTPFYDVTFSPSPYGEHATAFGGYGKNPPLKTVQKLAERAGFDDWQRAKIVIQQIIETVAQFGKFAKDLEVNPETIKLIEKQLNEIRNLNKSLI